MIKTTSLKVWASEDKRFLYGSCKSGHPGLWDPLTGDGGGGGGADRVEIQQMWGEMYETFMTKSLELLITHKYLTNRTFQTLARN